MAASLTEKEARLNIRVRPDIKDRIEKAASVSGKTMTDFAISALTKTANEVLEQHHITELSDRDRDQFLAILDKRSKPGKLLIRAAQTHKRLIVK